MRTSPTPSAPTPRPSNANRQSLLIEMAKHGHAPSLEQLANSITVLHDKAAARLEGSRPRALGHVLERLECTLMEDEKIGPALSTGLFLAAKQQPRPGTPLLDATAQDHNAAATAALNIKMIAQLANSRQLNAKVLQRLSTNINAIVDQLAQCLRNQALAETAQNVTSRNARPALDPNSPMAVLSALQGDGSLLTNILRDSVAATLEQMNLDAAQETQRQDNETMMLTNTAEQQRENQTANLDLASEQEQEFLEEQASQATADTAPRPMPPSSASKTDEKWLEQSLMQSHEAQQLVKTAQSGGFSKAMHGVEIAVKAAEVVSIASLSRG